MHLKFLGHQVNQNIKAFSIPEKIFYKKLERIIPDQAEQHQKISHPPYQQAFCTLPDA